MTRPNLRPWRVSVRAVAGGGFKLRLRASRFASGWGAATAAAVSLHVLIRFRRLFLRMRWRTGRPALISVRHASRSRVCRILDRVNRWCGGGGKTRMGGFKLYPREFELIFPIKKHQDQTFTLKIFKVVSTENILNITNQLTAMLFARFNPSLNRKDHLLIHLFAILISSIWFGLISLHCTNHISQDVGKVVFVVISSPLGACMLFYLRKNRKLTWVLICALILVIIYQLGTLS
ncbi:hypothetical protein QJS04_geneDACA017014 [Acorus gramineus]|uniref:Uncharacterized protein n=1 Tax=Acorus gramineus TaxID=55184 RepID=A0AAV9ALA1_ACOGR|nr:hypothetical protein QJS04_geneDACA017014 [Acorus gramineus]